MRLDTNKTHLTCPGKTITHSDLEELFLDIDTNKIYSFIFYILLMNLSLCCAFVILICLDFC